MAIFDRERTRTLHNLRFRKSRMKRHDGFRTDDVKWPRASPNFQGSIQNMIVLSFMIINQRGVSCFFTPVCILKSWGHVTTVAQFNNCDHVWRWVTESVTSQATNNYFFGLEVGLEVVEISLLGLIKRTTFTLTALNFYLLINISCQLSMSVLVYITCQSTWSLLIMV